MKKVSYKELGLVNTKKMFAKAVKGGYAIPAFNFPTILRYMAQGAVEYAKELGCKNPQIVLHLDHGDSFETCKSCIDMGFSSVMIDGSSLPFKENIKLTKKVVAYAHKYDVTVEAELGVLAGVEDEVSAAESHYTKPEEVIEFATKTLPRHLDRHLARRLQVQARAVHARSQDGPPDPAAARV